MTNEEIAREYATKWVNDDLDDPDYDYVEDVILAAINRAQSEEVKRLADLLEQMVNVAENADETGYVTDVGFVDLDKLHAKAREAIAAARKK